MAEDRGKAYSWSWIGVTLTHPGFDQISDLRTKLESCWGHFHSDIILMKVIIGTMMM